MRVVQPKFLNLLIGQLNANGSPRYWLIEMYERRHVTNDNSEHRFSGKNASHFPPPRNIDTI